CFLIRPIPLSPTLFPYTTLFRSHPPAGPPEHGPLEDLRGDVPGRPVPRFPDGQQLPCREHPGRRARARPCRLLEEQSALRPLPRSEEHTSELQSRVDLVCRLLLE